MQTQNEIPTDPPAEAPEVSRGDWLWWVPWALAAVFALLSVVLLSFGSSWRKANDGLAQRLAETESAYAELLGQQSNLQQKLTRVETNYANRIADLNKQVLHKAKEQERQKFEIEMRNADASQARKQVNMLQTQLAQNTAELDRLSEQLSGVNSPDQEGLALTRMELLMPTPDGPATASGAAMYDIRSQQGIFEAENLPPLGPDRDYQLWLLDPNLAAPVPAGVFRPNERGSARMEYKAGSQIRSPERFAVSVERKGGSAAPQGRFILASN